MGLVEKVRLVGYQSETDLVRMFTNSIAFLSPSKMEGFGLAAAEAMACGTPAIVSNNGALPEVVSHHKTGFVLPINQGPDPWIRAMISLSDDSALYKSYGEAAESRIKDMFTWERAGTQTEAVYQQVVDQYHHR
jgi:glycosyltransferase involved in cell wall biosynthesis